MIVEDDANTAELLVFAFGAAGFEVRFALDGEAALGAARAFAPDVVISDLDLPRACGYQLLAALRASPEPHDVPVIAVSGRTEPGERARALTAGFARFFAKPCALDTLLAAVWALLDRRRPSVSRPGAKRRRTPPAQA